LNRPLSHQFCSQFPIYPTPSCIALVAFYFISIIIITIITIITTSDLAAQTASLSTSKRNHIPSHAHTYAHTYTHSSTYPIRNNGLGIPAPDPDRQRPRNGTSQPRALGLPSRLAARLHQHHSPRLLHFLRHWQAVPKAQESRRWQEGRRERREASCNTRCCAVIKWVDNGLAV